MNTLTIQFDPSVIPDDALADLRETAVKRVIPLAGEFGLWLHKWCDHEQMIRHEKRPRPVGMSKHDLATPPLPNWTDREVAEALVAVTTLSYATADVVVGCFVDRLVLVVSEEAAARIFAFANEENHA